MGSAPPPHEKVSATETTSMELPSPDRMCEADHDNGFMTAGDQSREDVTSSIADLLTPKRRSRVELWNVRTFFRADD